MITHIFGRMEKVKNFFPDDYMHYFSADGYDVDLSDDYSPIVQYYIRYYGECTMAIINGTLKPFYPEQEDFLKVVRGEAPATTEVEKGWMKFMSEFPEIGQ
jgi:uncharacterized protein YifE (UPF0438 family)